MHLGVVGVSGANFSCNKKVGIMKTTTHLKVIKQCKCMGHGIWSVDDDVDDGDDDDDDGDDDDDRLHETVLYIIKAYDI